MLQWLHLNNSHAYPFCKTMPGTIRESRQQSCAIESLQQFFRYSNCDRIFVSETCSKWSQNYSVSESEDAPDRFNFCTSKPNMSFNCGRLSMQTSIFFKKMGQTLPLFVYFVLFSHHMYKYRTNLAINDKSIDGVLGSRTRGGRLVAPSTF